MSEELGEILGILVKNGVSEFEHEEDGIRLKIKCRTTTPPIKKPALKQEKPEEKMKEQAKEQSKPQENQFYILESAQVGYFHIFPQKSGAEEEIIEPIKEPAEYLTEPFVKVGDKVSLETILGTVECMKLQNEIRLANYKDFKANYGIIEKILEEENAPVDYGRPLFQIRPVKEE